MFGIMRPEGGCSNKNSSDYRFHRMHYCGVCKAMGNSYGHKSRLLLNYDSVFLSELLRFLSTQSVLLVVHSKNFILIPVLFEVFHRYSLTRSFSPAFKDLEFDV